MSDDKVLRPVAILLPDWESLRPGAGKDIYAQERSVQEYFEQTAHISTLNVTKLLFNGSESELRGLPESYILLFMLQVSILDYARRNYSLTHMGGIGLGALSALCAAQAFTYTDGLYVVSKWAHLYQHLLQEKNFKKIMIQGITRAALEKMVNGTESQLSERHAPDVYGVVGIRSALESLQEILEKEYPESTIQEVPLESGLYADLAPEVSAHFRQYLEKVEFHDTVIPCYAPDAAYDLQQAQQIKEFVGNQPFLFQDRVQLIERYEHADTLIIPFADEALLKQVQQRYPEKEVITFL